MTNYYKVASKHKKCQFWGSIAGIILSLCLIVVVVGGYFLLDFLLDREIKGFVIVSPTGSDYIKYDEWVHNDYPDAVPVHQYFYLHNITNLDDVLHNGAIPNVEEVGPFTYRLYIKKIDVEFNDKGTEVEFTEMPYNIYINESDQHPEDVYVTNINPAYLAIVGLVGSEAALSQLAIGITFTTIIDTYKLYFTEGVTQFTFAQTIQGTYDTLVSDVMSDLGLNQTEAEQHVKTTWANSTSGDTLPSYWDEFGILASGDFSATPSNITDEIFDKLWPMFVLDQSYVVSLWFGSFLNESIKETWAKTFSPIEIEQFGMVLAWMASYKRRNLISALITQYQNRSVSSEEDLVYLQWGSGVVTDYVSFVSLFGGLPGLPNVPSEIGIWSNRSVDWDVTKSRSLLDGPTSLMDSTNVITFLTLYAQGNLPVIQATWGLDTTEATWFFKYYLMLESEFVSLILQSVFDAGGGFFTTRTVDEWLWGAVDPLLALIDPENAVVSLIKNFTSEDQARANGNTFKIHTGKNDIDKITQVIEWNGKAVLPAGNPWPANVTVGGIFKEQAGPWLDSTEDKILSMWSADYLRQITLEYEKKTTKHGIRLYRYISRDEDFDVNPDYAQHIKGFLNLKPAASGIPYYVSRNRFYGCDEIWRQKINGTVPPSLEDRGYTDVEPITGYFIDIQAKVQYNVYLDNSTTYDKFNSDVPKDIMFPMVSATLQTAITKDLARTFTDVVYVFMDAQEGVLWGGIALGCLGIVISLCVLAWVVYRMRRDGYSLIGSTEYEDFN
eukprot:CAMPEP_0174260606 /NCGR_PEP_ID=MMETSP0439-20130205/10061_1 /TAXON_ID=0 /ORGANISM="Stereomyxa ramosa, Strain Chinc5" /LENGTH=779 /DNA_ID=CAMNT_0015344885 /DNA_START=52 /DNA_END=2391 /DNA_ORIENTATION=+